MSQNKFLKPKVYVGIDPNVRPHPKLPTNWPLFSDNRAFWDPQFNREYLQEMPRGVMTKQQFDEMIDLGVSSRQLMERMPAGIGIETVIEILMNELREKRREVRVLQDDKIDKILLEDDNGS